LDFIILFTHKVSRPSYCGRPCPGNGFRRLFIKKVVIPPGL
jgi:hypothetical protein